MPTLRTSLFACIVCLGCGGAPQQKAVAPVAAAPVVVAEPTPDLSPVSAPADLVLVGRWSRPRMLVETLAGWAGMPLRLTDLLPPGARELETVVAWDAPVEVAAVLDRRSTAKMPAPLSVVSLGLTSLTRATQLAKERGLGLTAVAPGVYRVAIHDDVSCAIAAAVGSAPARLVCGEDWQDVEELVPFATRGLPTLELGAEDVHIELRAAPLQRKYAQELSAVRLLAGLLLRQVQTDNPRLDRALTDTAYALADELRALASEIERFQIRARLDETQGSLELAYAFTWKGETSFVSQMMRGAATRAAPPPEFFWQLPRVAHSGGYGTSGDPKRLGVLVNAASELLDAYLEHRKLSAAPRKRVRAVLDSLPAFTNRAAYVSGSLPGVQSWGALARVLRGAGWYTGIVEVRADEVTRPLNEIAALLNDRAFAAWVKESTGLESRALPKLQKRVLAVKGFAARAQAFTLVVPAPLAALLESAEAGGEPASAGKAAPKPRPASVSFIVVPDGLLTWIALAPDEKSALERLDAARSGRDGKLSDVPELAALKADSAVSAGFWTLEALVGTLQSLRPSGRPEEVSDLFARMPNRGASPWLTRVLVQTAGPLTTVTGSARVPRATFQDLGALIPWLVPQALFGRKF